MEARQKKVHPCPHEGCGAVFNRPYRLSEHMLMHFNYKAYSCKEKNCNKSYSNKSHLNRHINTVHKSPEASYLLYSCPTCMKKYSNRQNLKRHMKEYHSPGSTRTILCCDVCKTEFKTKNQLTAHMYIHTGIKSFCCEICSKQFVTRTEMKKHMRFHKKYECTECQMKFDTWAAIQSHKVTEHKVDEYICNECGATFKLRCYLVRHIKIHTYTKTFYCPYENCPRFYTRNSNLKQHIMVNHLQFTFDCTICKARLTTKAKLDYHMNLHNAIRKDKVPPKTKATGRKERADKGVTKNSTALKIAGLPEALVEMQSQAQALVHLVSNLIKSRLRAAEHTIEYLRCQAA